MRIMILLMALAAAGVGVAQAQGLPPSNAQQYYGSNTNSVANLNAAANSNTSSIHAEKEAAKESQVGNSRIH